MDDLLTKFDDCLKDNGPVAIVMKQYLRPAEGKEEVIFPPTYPMPTYRGRIHTVRDGEYRVSVELPSFRPADGKAEKKAEDEQQNVAGYNIDEFKDGSNVCEIDSPQSQANRLEPLFKTIKDGNLVPQITIKVGDEAVNLLDAGHRAADAVVRLSSMVAQFHEAFREAQKGNHLPLAQLAPTSLLFGVWDSRGTQVKLPRLIKAEIRATNVQSCTRSAQFVPAIDYVRAGVVDEYLDTRDKSPLAAEGMKHVPAPRAAGGVRVQGEIRRVVRVNLVALRDLRALVGDKVDKKKTLDLQRYLFGLALVAATHPIQLNLREGCLLCETDDAEKKGSYKLVFANGEELPFPADPVGAVAYAEQSAQNFFGDEYSRKDVADARFERDVANRFLAMKAEDRDEISRKGPISEEAIRRFEERSRDPLKLVSEAIKEAKKALPRAAGKSAAPIASAGLFNLVSEKLGELTQDDQTTDAVKALVGRLQKLISDDKDTHRTFKELERQIREFTRQQKAGEASNNSAEPSGTGPA